MGDDVLLENHERIWLDRVCTEEERMWSPMERAFRECEDCEGEVHHPVEYIRADLAIDMNEHAAMLDALSKAKARIAELEAARTWQPIETIPINAHVLVYAAPYDIDATSLHPACQLPGFCAHTIYDGDDAVLYVNEFQKATHWMPIPEPPVNDEPTP